MKPSKILVAEDDPALLKSLRIRLTSEGYKVFCVQDAYQAVALASSEQPDLLILDVHLPAGDGFSIETRVRKLPNMHKVPIIYVTGDRSQELRERAEGLGVGLLLTKPFNTIELLEIVRNALEQSQDQAEPLNV
jgi:DNA-binding response OmpR family regulator